MSITLTLVDICFFDNDMFMRNDLFEVDRAVGVVVDLDLDDVPLIPARPSIAPVTCRGRARRCGSRTSNCRSW